MTTQTAPKLRPPDSTVLVTRMPFQGKTDGLIVLAKKGTINGVAYNVEEDVHGGQAFECRIVAIGVGRVNVRGNRETQPNFKIGDKILVQPHGGEKLLPGEPEMWIVDWVDVLAVVEEAEAA